MGICLLPLLILSLSLSGFASVRCLHLITPCVSDLPLFAAPVRCAVTLLCFAILIAVITTKISVSFVSTILFNKSVASHLHYVFSPEDIDLPTDLDQFSCSMAARRPPKPGTGRGRPPLQLPGFTGPPSQQSTGPPPPPPPPSQQGSQSFGSMSTRDPLGQLGQPAQQQQQFSQPSPASNPSIPSGQQQTFQTALPLRSGTPYPQSHGSAVQPAGSIAPGSASRSRTASFAAGPATSPSTARTTAPGSFAPGSASRSRTASFAAGPATSLSVARPTAPSSASTTTGLVPDQAPTADDDSAEIIPRPIDLAPAQPSLDNSSASLKPSHLNQNWPIGYNYQVAGKSYKPGDHAGLPASNYPLLPIAHREYGKVLGKQSVKDPSGQDRIVYEVSLPSRDSSARTLVPSTMVKVFPWGWPFECRQDKPYKPSNEAFMELQPGDAGYIREVKVPKSALTQGSQGERDDLVQFLVAVTDPKLRTQSDQAIKSGWVPRHAIIIGTGNAWGLTSIAGGEPLIQLTRLPSTSQLQQNPLANLIHCLSECYSENLTEFMDVPSQVQVALSTPDRRANVNQAIVESCFKTRGQQFYNRNQFTVEDLIALPNCSTVSEAVIYALLYWWCDENGKIVRMFVKVGKTGDSHARDAVHRNMESKAEAWHYDMVTGAHGRKMVGLCQITDATYQTFAEEYLSRIFGSFHPKVLEEKEWGPASSASSGPTATDAGASSFRKNTTAGDKVSAAALKKCDFVPFCRRTIATGLNWQTPLCEGSRNTRTMYLMFTTNDNYRVFSRGPISVQPASSTSFKVNISGNFAPTFYCQDGSLQYGDRVHPFIEICPPGEVHPNLFLRLPELMNWTGNELVRRMAVRIEYKSRTTGSWIRRYLQRRLFVGIDTQKGKSFDNQPAILGYDHAFRMAASLTRTHPDPALGLPDWRSRPFSAHIFEQTFHHLSQTYEFKDVQAPLIAGQVDTFRSFDDIKAEYSKLGLSLWRSHDRSCDYCLYGKAVDRIPNHYKDDPAPCSAALVVRNDDTGLHLYTCDCCRAYGRYCTWSPTHVLAIGTKAHKALFPPALTAPADLLVAIDAPERLAVHKF